MSNTPNPRHKLQEVMRRASQVDIGQLDDTELIRGTGKRPSPHLKWVGLGRMERIVKYKPGMPYAAINWPLTTKTFPREKLVIERSQLINKEWFIGNDTSDTMYFGTEGDLKVVAGATLTAIFALAAFNKKDKVAQACFNDKIMGPLLEQASVEEMVLSTLTHQARPIKQAGSAPAREGRSGLSTFLGYLPETPSVVPIISDFMCMTEDDAKALVLASRKHVLLCCVVEDAREKVFPEASGQITLNDMKTGRQETMSFDEAHRLVSADRAERIKRLEAVFQRARCGYAFFAAGNTSTQIRQKMAEMLLRRRPKG
jgi:uncharacterized protein (DUF58 family)